MKFHSALRRVSSHALVRVGTACACAWLLVQVRDWDGIAALNQALLATSVNYLSLVTVSALALAMVFWLRKGPGIVLVKPVRATAGWIFLFLMLLSLAFLAQLPQGSGSLLVRWDKLFVRYLGVALLEEFTFRLLIFELLRQVTSRWWALVGSSLLFAAFHFCFGPLGLPDTLLFLKFLALSVSGFVFCLLYLRWGIVAAVLVHWLVDVFGRSGLISEELFLFLPFAAMGFVLLFFEVRSASGRFSRLP